MSRQALRCGAVLMSILATASCRPRPSSALAAAAGGAGTAQAQAATPPSLTTLLKSGHFIATPIVRQARNFTCGAAALQSVLMHFGDEFREGQLQRILRSDRNDGTSYTEMLKLVKDLNDPQRNEALHEVEATEEQAPQGAGAALAGDLETETSQHGVVRKVMHATGDGSYALELHQGASTKLRDAAEAGEAGVPKDGLSLKELEAYIDQGRPVIVMIQAWSGSDAPDWKSDWDDGHFVVATGYDKDRVYFMDPSTLGNYTYIPRAEFLERWHDVDVRKDPATGQEVSEKLTHFALVVHKKKATFDREAILRLE